MEPWYELAEGVCERGIVVSFAIVRIEYSLRIVYSKYLNYRVS